MKALQRHWTYFHRVRRDLLWLLWLSLGTYIGIEIASAWPSSAYWIWRLGQGFSVLAMAYVSAFIFYYFVNHISEEKDRELLSELALRPLEQMQVGNDTFLGHIVGDEFFKSEDLSFNEIKDIVRKVDLSTVIDFGHSDAPQEMTLADHLEMWFNIDNGIIKKILGHGLKIEAETLALLHILKDHTTLRFKFPEGSLDKDNNTVTRYRIAETIYFTNVLIKQMKRYTSASNIRDDEYRAAMKRNIGRLQEEINETARLRKEGKLIFEEDLSPDSPILKEIKHQRRMARRRPQQ
jgi:hypothetical protein